MNRRRTTGVVRSWANSKTTNSSWTRSVAFMRRAAASVGNSSGCSRRRCCRACRASRRWSGSPAYPTPSARYEQSARNDGFPGFQFTENHAYGRARRAEKRAQYFPVYYVEPRDGNVAAVGYDLASDSVRAEAQRLAGHRQGSGHRANHAVQEQRHSTGVLVFIPVYARDLPTGTVAQRRHALQGFVLGVPPRGPRGRNRTEPAGPRRRGHPHRGRVGPTGDGLPLLAPVPRGTSCRRRFPAVRST